MSDFHRRDAEQFASGFMSLLPEGPIWPRARGAQLWQTVLGLMGVVARWADDTFRFLMTEAFPPTSIDLLPDWERVLGLPEPCITPTDLTIVERQLAVREKLARRPGAQSREYFWQLAYALGYEITITEHRPAQCAMTPCGFSESVSPDGRFIIRGCGLGTPAIRFVWTVAVAGPRLTWFAFGAGGGRCGQDPHLRIRRAEDLECLLNKLKPAHTRLVFNYTGV